MCSCHDWPQPVKDAIRATEREDNTREDWEDSTTRLSSTVGVGHCVMCERTQNPYPPTGTKPAEGEK